MGLLQQFERRLEGAVEGFFARTFRSGLQPIELAKGLRRYAEEQRQVTQDGMVIPNVYLFRLNPKDHERLAGYGRKLTDELAEVVGASAREEAWGLTGLVVVTIQADPDVSYGMFRLNGRIDADATPAAAPEADSTPTPDGAEGADTSVEAAEDVPADESAATAESDDPSVPSAAASPANPVGDAKPGSLTLRISASGETVVLESGRSVAGRLPDNEITLDDTTVSRAHAAFVRRGDEWWVLDLGSTNGTKVNGRTAAEHPVRPGDQVQLGEAIVDVVET